MPYRKGFVLGAIKEEESGEEIEDPKQDRSASEESGEEIEDPKQDRSSSEESGKEIEDPKQDRSSSEESGKEIADPEQGRRLSGFGRSKLIEFMQGLTQKQGSKNTGQKKLGSGSDEFIDRASLVSSSEESGKEIADPEQGRRLSKESGEDIKIADQKQDRSLSGLDSSELKKFMKRFNPNKVSNDRWQENLRSGSAAASRRGM